MTLYRAGAGEGTRFLDGDGDDVNLGGMVRTLFHGVTGERYWLAMARQRK